MTHSTVILQYGRKDDAGQETGDIQASVAKPQTIYPHPVRQLTRGTGLPKPSRETKFSGTNADRGILFFPVQLTTSRIGNLTRLIHTLAICVTI